MRAVDRKKEIQLKMTLPYTVVEILYSHHKFESIHFYWTRPLMQQGLHFNKYMWDIPPILHQYEQNSFFFVNFA